MVNNDIDIGTRLKALRDRLKIKMPVVALATGIAKETLYKWEKGTKPSDINFYFILKRYLDKMERKEDQDGFDLETSKPATLRLPLDPNKPTLPQLDGKASSGAVIFTENGPELIVDRINAPFMGHIEGAVEITGESMEPTFKNGSRVAIIRLQNAQILDWGHYYLIIDYNHHSAVKRIYQGSAEGFIVLASDNLDQARFPPVERNQDQIIAILKVVGSINKH
jgi:phage repressor protein C with HTH and peptisase S24 domain